jgi:hypothetical protein
MTNDETGTRHLSRAVIALAAAGAVLSCARPGMPAREFLQYNVETVREGRTDRMLEHCFKIALMVLHEPAWDGAADGYDRAAFVEQKEYFRSIFHKPLIGDWLAGLEEPGSDLSIRAVYEFGRYDEMVEFLGGDPETNGIPVVEAVFAPDAELQPEVWPAEHVAFISRWAPRVFPSDLWPLVVRHEARGEDWTGLRLMEEARVVDRWAIAYLSSKGVLYGTLMLRVRGLWALWPLVH